jgi:hypothetical protein
MKRPVVAKRLTPPAPPVPPTPPALPAETPSPSKKWTEESMTELIDSIKRNPHDVDWKALSVTYNRTEATLRSIYASKVSPVENAEYCMASLVTSNALEQILVSKRYECAVCGCHRYSIPKKWGEEKLCEECHTRLYKEEIEERWGKITDHMSSTGKDRCNLCNIETKYNKETCNRFHFDHINMFEKGDSICSMVISGISMEEIYQEINMCQVICISCHAIVTEVERKCGFMRVKNNMTRDAKKGLSIEDTEENIKKRYNEIMKPIYDVLRERLK